MPVIEEPKRYTMGTGEVAERLQCSRETVHNLTQTGELSFISRSRGTREWKFFDPKEVEALAQRRGVELNP
jgi:excisionase family DNA binding protein